MAEDVDGEKFCFGDNQLSTFATQGIVIRGYHHKYANFGPGGWLHSMVQAIEFHFGVAPVVQEETMIGNAVDFLDTPACPLKFLVYQMPMLYVDDLVATNGTIARFAGKILHGPFVDPMTTTFSFSNMRKLCDSLESLEVCASNIPSHHGRCYFFPQCLHAHKATQPKSVVIFYLKTYGKKNEEIYHEYIEGIVVPMLKAEVNSLFPHLRVVYFRYGHYERAKFMRSVGRAVFAVAYSPGETMGLFHVEIRSHGVPMFILEPKAVHFFTELSGVVVNAQLANSTNQTESLVRVPFVKFMNQLHSYRPIADLISQGLMFAQCGAVLRNISGHHVSFL